MSGFVTALMHRGPRTALSRYTELCGLLYAAMGLFFAFAPGVATGLLGLTTTTDAEGYVRLLGLTLSVIGYFYWFGGRTGAKSFGVATVVDRLALPFVLLPMAFVGWIEWPIAIAFSILDPLMGLGALIIWMRGGGDPPEAA